MAGEEARYAQVLAVIEAAKTDPRIKDAITKAAIAADAELIKPIFDFRNFGVQLPHHWSTVLNGAAFGTDYFTRTAIAKSNILVNTAQETAYFYQDLDANGARLNGANRYTITFPKDQNAARQRLLVADALQRPPLLRAQSDQALLARHQEQDAEARPRRVADDLRAGRFAGRGQGIELATRAKGRRLLTLWARVLAEARDHRRLLDAAAREAGGVSRAGICGGAMQTHHRGIAAILPAAGQRGAGRERWSHVRRSWRWPVSARPSS
jgi:hypothetical protein